MVHQPTTGIEQGFTINERTSGKELELTIEIAIGYMSNGGWPDGLLQLTNQYQ